MNNPNLEIGTRIKNARAQLHITQTDLARKLSVSQTAIALWESGKREVSIDMIGRIADILKCTPAELIWGKETTKQWEELQNEKKIIAQDFSASLAALKELLLENESAGIFSNDPEEDLLYYFWNLNKEGQNKAIEQVELLTKIPEYQAKIEKSEEVIQKLNNDGNLTE